MENKKQDTPKIRVYRIKKEPGNFITVSKSFMHDKNLSAVAKTIGSIFLSQSDTYILYQTKLKEYMQEKETAIRNGILELVQNGYIDLDIPSPEQKAKLRIPYLQYFFTFHEKSKSEIILKFLHYWNWIYETHNQEKFTLDYYGEYFNKHENEISRLRFHDLKHVNFTTLRLRFHELKHVKIKDYLNQYNNNPNNNPNDLTVVADPPKKVESLIEVRYNLNRLLLSNSQKKEIELYIDDMIDNNEDISDSIISTMINNKVDYINKYLKYKASNKVKYMKSVLDTKKIKDWYEKYYSQNGFTKQDNEYTDYLLEEEELGFSLD